jgi:hypothetical protein
MRLPLTIVLSFLLTLLNAQYNVPKFGKIDMSDMTMSRYEKDTAATALILFDDGNSWFDLNIDGNFQYRYVRHYRIKIFDKSALDISNISIKLYQRGANEESLSGLNAATYNLVDGKIVQTKLDKDKIYRENSRNYTTSKFALPEVKEGSIIEVTYSITSDFLYNFRGWKFQFEYPSLLSQYKYVIPEYFMYRPLSKGYLKYDVYKTENGNVTFNHPNIITASTSETTIAIKDVPAFVPEPNIDCEDNYIQSIEFELSSIQFPGQIRKDYAQTWESVNNEMNDDEDFGLLLKADGFIKDTVDAIVRSSSSEIQNARDIYNYVQKRMEWNERYSIYAGQGLKKPFNERIGNSCEINLLLTIMMQRAGLAAEPVLFSTRGNGFAKTFYPTMSKFNSVLVKLSIEGKIYLLDATNKFCPFGVIPPSDINGRGRVVNNTGGDWAELTCAERYKVGKSYQLQISEDGVFKGFVLGFYDGYAGVDYRDELDKEKNTDDYIRKLQENINGLAITSYTISERDNIYKPLTDTFNVEINNRAEIIGDKILFRPLLFESLDKNMYTLEERNYPVDYNFPISEVCVFDYSLPEGYEVESLPESLGLKLPDNSISVVFAVQVVDNKIKVVYKRNVNKIMFLPDEYSALKEMFDQIVKKHAEEIILRKIV